MTTPKPKPTLNGKVLRNFPKFTLISSIGNYSVKQACIMSAAVAKQRYINGEDLNGATDQLECCCPVIRTYAIAINDSSIWKDSADRTKHLLPIIDKLLDTKGSRKLEVARGFLCADYAVRRFAPLALEVAGLKEEAEKLRKLAPIVDKNTTEAASNAARSASDAASDAARAAASDASYAARAASDATSAASYAARYATSAASYAASYAARAARSASYAAQVNIKKAVVNLLKELCDMKDDKPKKTRTKKTK